MKIRNRISCFIIALVLLLDAAAYAQIPSDTTLHIFIYSLSETNVSLTVSNTHQDVLYEYQIKLNKTNWLTLGFNRGSEITNRMLFTSWFPREFYTNSHIPITAKSIRVRSWNDSDNMGIPDWWKIQYFGDVVIDGYGNPMGDGWSNIQKFQNGMNPFKWYPPEGPQVQVNFRDGVDSHHANAILNWRCDSGLIPDNITIERAHQTRRGMTNYITFPLIHHRADGQIVTNWPLHSLSSIYNNSLSPTAQRLNNFVIFGSYQPIAQMPGQPNLRDYRYVDANINCYPPPVYQIQAHYPKPTQFAELSDTTARAISHTVLSVTAKRQTNGYVLTVLHPITHARYLLLVRDKNDPQWRASGYFLSGMNQNPMILHVDKNGMMTDPQIPIALPPVKYLADVVQPEFTAGWGEDSDRDGLPDIYEVLVTHTEPDNADTGDLGIPDGFRVVSNDGWNNWDKFRFRVNPFTHCEPAAPIVLKKPTISELRRAYSSNTDLPYTLQIEFQTNTATGFQPYSLWVDSNYVNPDSSGHARCDVRVSWKVPPANP